MQLNQVRMRHVDIHIKIVGTQNHDNWKMLQNFFTQIHLAPGVRNKKRGQKNKGPMHTCLLKILQV